MTAVLSHYALGLDTHPCASRITQTFFAELEHHRHSVQETQQFFQEFIAVLRFMSIEQLRTLRSMLVTPADLNRVDQELSLRHQEY